MAYTVEVIRSDRRTLSLEIRDRETVLVRAPRRMAQWRIKSFVNAHRDWIEARLEKLAAQPLAEPLSEVEIAQLKKRGKQVFPERAAYYAPLVGVSYGRIAVRCQKTKWGSCSSKGNLNFNCLLLLAPPEVLDYVVVHELCHRREMNHSPRFWAEVERVLPDYRESRRWLRQHGGELMGRAPAD